MNDRLVTLLGALGALLLMVALLGPGPGVEPPSQPHSEERGADGLWALYHWLGESGVNVQSLRLPLGQLPEYELPASGNILLSVFPHRKRWRAGEYDQLAEWLDAGNTLLLFAALDESPYWLGHVDGGDIWSDLYDFTGLSFDEVIDDNDEPLSFAERLEAQEVVYRPHPAHPLMRGVEALRGMSDTVTHVWRPDLSNEGEFVAALAQIEPYGIDAVWQIPRYAGQVIVVASSTLPGNRMLGEADNARFIANIIDWHLVPGGAVIFDDYHHGLSDLYDPEDFFADPRLHNTIAFVLAFWLLYLLAASSRLVIPRAPVMTVNEIDLVSATGRLMARKLRPEEAGRVLLAQWRDEMQRNGAMPRSDSLEAFWARLAAHPLVDNKALAHLQQLYARMGRGENVELHEIYNAIAQVKRTMT